jgi:hypothetical protein
MSLSTSDSVVEGILEFSLKPYAKQNGIDVVNLINDLYIYHTKKSLIDLDAELRKPVSIQINNIQEKESNTRENINESNEASTGKKRRGRPKGSKNKKKTKDGNTGN